MFGRLGQTVQVHQVRRVEHIGFLQRKVARVEPFLFVRQKSLKKILSAGVCLRPAKLAFCCRYCAAARFTLAEALGSKLLGQLLPLVLELLRGLVLRLSKYPGKVWTALLQILGQEGVDRSRLLEHLLSELWVELKDVLQQPFNLWIKCRLTQVAAPRVLTKLQQKLKELIFVH